MFSNIERKVVDTMLLKQRIKAMSDDGPTYAPSQIRSVMVHQRLRNVPSSICFREMMSCGRAQKYEKIISEGFHLVAKDVEGIRDTWRLPLSRAETTLFNDISSLEKKIYFISSSVFIILKLNVKMTYPGLIPM